MTELQKARFIDSKAEHVKSQKSAFPVLKTRSAEASSTKDKPLSKGQPETKASTSHLLAYAKPNLFSQKDRFDGQHLNSSMPQGASAQKPSSEPPSLRRGSWRDFAEGVLSGGPLENMTSRPAEKLLGGKVEKGYQSQAEIAGHLARDIGIGLIPVVGEIADAADCLSSAASAIDGLRKGDKKQAMDGLIGTGIGAAGFLLPFVSSRAIKTLVKAGDHINPTIASKAVAAAMPASRSIDQANHLAKEFQVKAKFVIEYTPEKASIFNRKGDIASYFEFYKGSKKIAATEPLYSMAWRNGLLRKLQYQEHELCQHLISLSVGHKGPGFKPSDASTWHHYFQKGIFGEVSEHVTEGASRQVGAYYSPDTKSFVPSPILKNTNPYAGALINRATFQDFATQFLDNLDTSVQVLRGTPRKIELDIPSEVVRDIATSNMRHASNFLKTDSRELTKEATHHFEFFQWLVQKQGYGVNVKNDALAAHTKPPSP